MNISTDLFKINHNNILPQSGRMLISEPFQNEPSFQRSVVIIVEHDSEGSMGLVLNKPCKITLNQLIEGLDELEHIPVFNGGPVDMDRLFYLHTLGSIIPDSIEIQSGLFINGDFEVMISYLKSDQYQKGQIKFFLGYSGWDSGQLHEEIKEDSWVVSKTQISEILRLEVEHLWKESLLTLGTQYRTWVNCPKNPQHN